MEEKFDHLLTKYYLQTYKEIQSKYFKDRKIKSFNAETQLSLDQFLNLN